MSTDQWRAGFSRRGALAPPSAGQRKLFRLRHQPRLHRVPFNVALDAIILIVVSDDAIKILFLPKLFAALSQQFVSQESRRTLNASNNLAKRNYWRAKQVQMIGHNNEGMQGAKASRVGFKQLFLYHARDLWPTQVRRTISSGVEKTIPSHESLTGRQVFALKDALGWKAAPEAPGNECGHSWRVDVWKAAAIGSHLLWCGNPAIILKRSSGAKASRRLKPALQ